MAAHITKQVIDAIAALILAAATSAGTDVYTGRVNALSVDKLPAVHINGGDEEIQILAMSAPAPLQRDIAIEIEVIVQALDAYDAAAYTLLKEIEHVIAANPTASGKVRAIFPTGVRWERAGEGDQPIVRATLLCRAQAYVNNNAVDTPL